MKALKTRDFKRSLEHAVVGISFLALSFIASTLFNPIISSEAFEQSASDGNSVYSASISNNSNVSINVAPSGEQRVFTVTDRISYTNTCPQGFLVTMSSTSSNTNLVRTGNDSYSKTIPSMSSGTTLADNTWGYTTSGVDGPFHPIPALSSPDTILDTSAAATTATNLDVIYGLKVDNHIPAGAYQGSVVYTITVKPQCLKYSLSWDLNGGIGKAGASYEDTAYDYGSEINLQNYTPTRSGYVFTGWSNGTTTFAVDSAETNVNPANATTVTLTAQWRPMDLFDISNMQDMTAAICNATQTPVKAATSFDWDGSHRGANNYVPRKSLTDTRDNKNYLVSKLADGNCWMSQNLALDLTSNAAIVASKTDGTTVSATPNRSTDTTLTTWAQNDNNWRSYRPPTNDSYYRGGTTKSSSASGTGTAYDWEKAGNYYNWVAATAGTGTSTMTNSEAIASICPKGWRLPPRTGTKSYSTLITTTYGLSGRSGASSLYATPLHFIRAGYHNTSNRMSSQASNGYYWTSSAYSNNRYAYTFYFSGTSITASGSNYKGSGYSIRCVAI